MKDNVLASFLVGFCLGVVALMVIMEYSNITPSDYYEAMKPALEATGIKTGSSADELRRALNPCVVSGQLPAGCEKYVKDGGVVSQPPIRIIIDTSK